MRFVGPLLLVSIVTLSTAARAGAAPRDPFSKDHLVAWCIVPFDAKHRGPVERAQMLQRLGIRHLAYDWREKDIPTFDAELDALTEYGIKLDAFWLASGPEPAKDRNVAAVLDFLKRRKVRTQIWYMAGAPAGFAELPQAEKVSRTAEAVRYIAAEAAKTGSSVGLYNHGGWFGEPENQIEIIRRLKMKNVGIVYNFHHGHDHIDRFPELLKKMMPHLMAINLNGMRRGGAKILYIGEGDEEARMIETIRRGGYRGLIGILNHREDTDAEVGLSRNLEGLEKLLKTK